uniref:HSF-type DNA-binding domain-containing protein n=1 Tax=Pseudo-nitzschia australis TaxID=44445 RepID=A0A7S4AI81_9STRA|mmetsp:Transcript_3181/g.6865  ORF Transcript_3181/g.6865 Transcript_3181/m.6865 type:complete len:476 (-) Transcript_3181:38-1465(-)
MLMATMAPIPRLLSKIGSNGEVAFPWKLHIVLEESERHGFDDVISWQGNKAFKVHNPKKFEASVMKEYFNNSQYKSFQRQLNIYGFTRVAVGDGGIVGSYNHKFLVRGKPNMCLFMVRTKVKKRGSRSNLMNNLCKELKKSKSVKDPEVTSSASASASHNIVKTSSLPQVTFSKRLTNDVASNQHNAAFSKSKSFSEINGQNDGALERLLFSSCYKSQPSLIDDATPAMNTWNPSLSSAPVNAMKFENDLFLEDPIADAAFSESIFSCKSNVINDSSSQQSSHTNEGRNGNKLGMVPLQYEDNETSNNSTISIHDSNNPLGSFHQQQQEELNYLQQQQQNRFFQEYKRLETLKQQQMQLQQEEYRLVQRLQLQNLHSTTSECNRHGVIPNDFNNEISNVSSNTNGNNFWDSMDKVDLDPIPILPEISVSLKSVMHPENYNYTNGPSLHTSLSTNDKVQMISVPTHDLTQLLQGYQ